MEGDQQIPGGKRVAVRTSWDEGAVEDRRLGRARADFPAYAEDVSYCMNIQLFDWLDAERRKEAP